MRLDRDAAESLRKELALLAKNEGFIQRRLFGTPIVDEVLRYARDDTYERLKSRFLSAIDSIDNEHETELLLDVFALSPETEDIPRLQQRRTLHGRKVGVGIDTVAKREKAALDHLHSRLVAGTYAQSPLVLHVPEMHGGIIYEHTSTLIIVKDRKWLETHEYYRFANMINELEYVTVTRSYHGIVFPNETGDFKVNTRPVSGAGYNDHFWHIDDARTKTEPMEYGKIYDLRFTIRPDPEKQMSEDSIKLATRAFHERSLLASIQVKFIGDRPASLWKFEKVSPYAIPNEADEYTQRPLNEHGIATLRLRDVHGGLFSGLSWSW